MNHTFKKVCNKVLKKITPTTKERKRINKLAGELKQKVTVAAREANVEAEIRVEGSVAKDTWLSGDPEIDVFMRLSTSLPRRDFEKVSLEIARKATEGTKQIERFAEHPYLEAFVNNVRVNVVPCYRVEQGQWKSATDRTPFHTDYVNSLLNEQMCSEVRLLKKFMKGVDVYGAEIQVGGFSGYLCELLILNYGSFKDVLEAFARWKPRSIIDYENYYKERTHEAELLFEEPLVIVDPVDKGRNVASAVRKERLNRFIAASRAFLKSPSVQFFYPTQTAPLTPEMLIQALKTRGCSLVFLKFGKVQAVSDILWGQLYKSQKSLRNLLRHYDFHIIRDSVWSDEKKLNMFVFEVEQRHLPPIKRHIGPPIEKQVACEKFLRKHLNSPRTISGPYIEGGRWIVEIQRKYTDVVNLLSEKLRDGGRRVGIAGHISEVVSNTLKILVNEEIIDFYNSNPKFAKFLTRYLEGKPLWLK
ncbi:MAG: CCA tRNA nucleotidyltransferase [Thermoproteota archaeon]|nr:CCA tRNA nucleotidyltransferase [Thermoproteota archaeon]